MIKESTTNDTAIMYFTVHANSFNSLYTQLTINAQSSSRSPVHTYSRKQVAASHLEWRSFQCKCNSAAPRWCEGCSNIPPTVLNKLHRKKSSDVKSVYRAVHSPFEIILYSKTNLICSIEILAVRAVAHCCWK